MSNEADIKPADEAGIDDPVKAADETFIVNDAEMPPMAAAKTVLAAAGATEAASAAETARSKAYTIFRGMDPKEVTKFGEAYVKATPEQRMKIMADLTVGQQAAAAAPEGDKNVAKAAAEGAEAALKEKGPGFWNRAKAFFAWCGTGLKYGIAVAWYCAAAAFGSAFGDRAGQRTGDGLADMFGKVFGGKKPA